MNGQEKEIKGKKRKKGRQKGKKKRKGSIISSIQPID